LRLVLGPAQQFRPLIDRVLDMAVDHRALGAPDQGTDDGVRLARIADLQALRHRDEALAERVENRLLDQDA
jgi:hypothetical protein